MNKLKKISSLLLGLLLVVSVGCATTGDVQNINIGDKVQPQLIQSFDKLRMYGEFIEPQVLANLFITLRGQDGQVKDYREYHNIITTAGKTAVIQQILGATGGGAQPAKFNYVGIGTGTTGELVGDTILEAEVGTRVQDTSPDLTVNVGVLIVTFGAGNGTGAITESGVLNGSTGNTLLCRKTFAAINKGASDSLQITWTITVN